LPHKIASLEFEALVTKEFELTFFEELIEIGKYKYAFVGVKDLETAEQL